jgi:rSAM/selenodomain-associated transferase 2
MIRSLSELSVVIAARNESSGLPSLLADLAPGSAQLLEVVVVDGGSVDGTARLAQLAGARVLPSEPCRGAQLAAGVAATDGAWLLLLHADVRLPRGWQGLVRDAMERGPQQTWAFRLAVDDPRPALRLVEALVSLRSRWRRLPYGDQGLLVSRLQLRAAGGISPIPLMEDLDLVLRLRRLGAIGLLPGSLRVSGRRWRRLGVLGTALANARLRRAWRRGTPPGQLAQRYYGVTSEALMGPGVRGHTRRRSDAAGAPVPSPDPRRNPPRGGRRRG